MTGGPEVNIVRADLKNQLERKRIRLLNVRDCESIDEVKKNYRMSLKMKPTGNAFLDMMLWKGRAPSTKAQFCTEILKLWPILFWLDKHYPKSEYEWLMHTGIRNEESQRREKIINHFSWNDFFDCLSVFPILKESRDWELRYLESLGVPPNPLYVLLDQPRVGCFPCIHTSKGQLWSLPDWAWDRLKYYELQIERTWFRTGIIPGKPDGYLTTVDDVREWSKTSRGGYQYDIFKSTPKEDAPSCMTGWMKCE